MTAAQEMDPSAPHEAGPVELIARVIPRGDQFLASVDGLELESSGRTPEAAMTGLVQAMRGWLERQDTVGRLGQALGMGHLDEETEIVLRFAEDEPCGNQSTGD